jgi:hypothetical protein
MTAHSDRLVVLGYLTAIAIPPLGVILGVVIAVRPTRVNSSHGAGIIVLGIVACILWFLILASGVLTTTSSDGSY